jgi:sortase A
MTAVVEAVRVPDPPPGPDQRGEAPGDSPQSQPAGRGRDAARWSAPRGNSQPPSWGRLVAVTVAGVVAIVMATVVVIYWIGPLVHSRDQHALLTTERTAISQAASDTEGLHRATLPTEAPQPGSVVGILAVPAIGIQQAVVEGAGPSQTISGPGHIPGTAGLGQPGNSAVVGRRSGYGGPFGQLGELRKGDRILTATVEGRSVYVVHSVRIVTMVTPTTAAATTETTAAGGPSGSTPTTAAPTSSAHLPAVGSQPAGHVGVHGVPKVSANVILGPSKGNQITLLTSGSSVPWNTGRTLVVIGELQGHPYQPTPQEARSPSQQGNAGDPTALAWFILAALALAACFAGAFVLYRRSTPRSAYLLTTAPLLVFTILAAEALSRLLPAWL